MTEKENKNTETPMLDSFGVDLTKLAEEETLDPIVGREKEIERISQILSRRKKNNPVLIGDPGVGKSSIAEGVAQRIILKKVPRTLYNKKVFTIDLGSMVAGTKYRGQFEERIKALVEEIKKEGNIIIFIDELHTLVGAGGSSGSLDAANMLKPALARGEIQCIGATTLDEYRQHIEKDGALERRFQKVIINPSTKDETLEILKNIKSRYEDHHNVEYTDEALESCVNLTDRYLADRSLPDKAVDALDEAGSRAQISYEIPQKILDIENEISEIKDKKMKAVEEQDFEKAADFRDKEKIKNDELKKEKENWETEISKNRKTVTKDNVSEVISLMSGVPSTSIKTEEGKKLKNLKNKIENLVIGQNEAVEKVVKSIHRSRSGLKDPNRPNSFIYLGPTGVGKTQLAKVLSREFFDSEDNLIRIDMSEYGEKFTASRLTGAAPGYVGYEEGGELTEKVRRKPYSIILLDEVEKAHPDIFNILLQILDEGHITDSSGRKVDFKNTIIIMTSNIGVKELKDFGNGIGFQTKSKVDEKNEHNKSVINKALNRQFRPEFINRVDDIIIFNSLEKEDLIKIVDIELNILEDRIYSNKKIKMEVSKTAKSFLSDKGYDPQYGARPLKRAIQKYVEDPLSELFINEDLNEGDTIKITYRKNSEELIIKTKQKQEK